MAGDEELGPNSVPSNGGQGSSGRERPRGSARQVDSGERELAERELNSIEGRRKPKKAFAPQDQSPPAVAEARADAAIPRISDRISADSDPWTVPQSVRDRFVQDGHRFYFADGKEAFKDRGRRLTTSSENTQVVHGLIEIAQARGWTEITVSGTERFRQEAWRQARLAGLAVRGYKSSEVEQQLLVRALVRNLQRAADTVDVIASEAPPSAAPDNAAVASPIARERIAGKLLEHGRDSYRHDPNEEPSYFVKVQTAEGSREIWGKDIERALAKSLTQPQVGDEVVLQQTGRDAVTVKRVERGPQGELQPREVDVYRNRWVIEKSEFFVQRARAADFVRDPSIDPRVAVREHPQLVGTYLNLRAAELAARALRDPNDQKRFVALVRSALADGIERGEPFPTARLRERVQRAMRSPDQELGRT
jgi:hypothetical protein